jgi:hypothetical protein
MLYTSSPEEAEAQQGYSGVKNDPKEHHTHNIVQATRKCTALCTASYESVDYPIEHRSNDERGCCAWVNPSF